MKSDLKKLLLNTDSKEILEKMTVELSPTGIRESAEGLILRLKATPTDVVSEWLNKPFTFGVKTKSKQQIMREAFRLSEAKLGPIVCPNCGVTLDDDDLHYIFHFKSGQNKEVKK